MGKSLSEIFQKMAAVLNTLPALVTAFVRVLNVRSYSPNWRSTNVADPSFVGMTFVKG